MFRTLIHVIKVTFRFHLPLALFIVVFSAGVISVQIEDRQGFANSELHLDVIERWGAPIEQAAPSVRYVGSGTVFNALTPLPMARQRVRLDSVMNYRKRGLVYFSGFDFTFSGRYEVENPEPREIDLVFVFPVASRGKEALLSELTFAVDDAPAEVTLSAARDRLVWTGRLAPGGRMSFDVSFRGRGLEHFIYRLDPSLPVRDFELSMDVVGGDNYDYPAGVVAAHDAEQSREGLALRWRFASLEAGVPVGAILPSEKSFDQIISRMARRGWAPFIAFFIALIVLGIRRGRALVFHEAVLLSSAYAFFFVLLAYLAAYVHFYLAYPVALALVSSLLAAYGRRLFGPAGVRQLLGLSAAFLAVPTFAVVLEHYTGLVYTLEIFGALATLMILTSREGFLDAWRSLFAAPEKTPQPTPEGAA